MSAPLAIITVEDTEELTVMMTPTNVLEVIIADAWEEGEVIEESSGAGYLKDEFGNIITDETGGAITDR